MNHDGKNYYDILEVTIEATNQEISQGYTRAKNAYSTDSLALYSLMTTNECEEIVNLIEEAYSVLSDPHKRILYNQARGLTTPPTEKSTSTQINSFQRVAEGHPTEQMHRSKSKKDIIKIVSSKKFFLDFKVNPEMEQDIEQTTVFTGEVLQKIREYKNVDIPRMADMTKVSKTYIKNIEAEKHENLPVMVYVRGFVYQYAKCLKLNPDLVATSYINHIKQLKESNN